MLFSSFTLAIVEKLSVKASENDQWVIYRYLI